MKRALVIGGTGFLGLNLVDALLHRGIATRVTWRKQSITVFVTKRDVELARGDLSDPESLEAAMVGCDTVFLVGGHYPRYSLDRGEAIAAGVRDVDHTCSAARRAGARVVYTSSIASLGVSDRPLNEDDVPETMPEDVYRAVKWSMERAIERHARDGLDVVTLLPGGCLGPWDVRVGTGGLLVGFVTGVLPWWVDGIVNLVDVRDVAAAHVRAAMHARAGERFCLAGHTVSMRSVLELVRRRYGGTFPSELSLAEARRRASAAERTASRRRARVPFPRELVDIIGWSQAVSSDYARHRLGFESRPLEETLDDAHEWFRRFGYLRPPSTIPQQRNT